VSGRAARAAKRRNEELKGFAETLFRVGYGYGVPWKRLRAGHIKRREPSARRVIKSRGFTVLRGAGVTGAIQ